MSTNPHSALARMLAITAMIALAACTSESTAPAEDKTAALRDVLTSHNWRLAGPCSEGLKPHTLRFDVGGKVIVYERLSDTFEKSTMTPYVITVNDAGVFNLIGVPPCGSMGDVVVYSYSADTVKFYQWMLVRAN
jgi:hypothetical protein